MTTTTRIDRGSTATTTVYTEGPELVFERTFDAPRDLVWAVMTDPERVTHWWGPRGHTATVVEMDLRVGGRWRWIGHTPDGRDVPFKGEYLEVDQPSRLVQTEIFDVPGFDDKVAVNTLTFEAIGDQTKFVARSRFPSVEDVDGALSTGMVAGAIESYDRFAEALARG